MTWFHLKYLNQWKFANTYIDSLSKSLNIYIDTLSRYMYIYAKNTINMYAWTLYTPIHDFICYALNPFDIFKSFNICIYIYINLGSTSLHVHTPVPQCIHLSTNMGHVYDPAAWQIFESAPKERYAYRYVQWWSSTGTRREYSTGLSVHPRKCYMLIQCGQRGFARPRKPGQSNRGMYFMLTNHIMYVEAGTYNGIFRTGDFRTKNSGTRLPFQWWRFGT